MPRRRPQVQLPGLALALGIGSLIVGTALTLSVYQNLSNLDAAWLAALHPEPHPSYLVATRTLPVGHVLTGDDLRPHTTPGWLPPELLQDPGALVGRTVQERILAGDAIRSERLAPGNGRGGLSALIPSGQRALSIHLTHADRVGGFIEPGDHVDLLATLYSEGQPAETVTLMERVVVLSVDDHLAEVPLGQTAIKPQVTLMVSPDDANRITHALHSGHPRLVLRPEVDPAEVAPRLAATGP
ncbi:MAG TPA: Flp pilus assembly protein CpaB [Deltaproteobacteria bacterium]|nr:Flp pilus assembly protein CpaB [Deltaproteobacteria bacterium]